MLKRSSLSISQQRLLEVLQRINYGRIEGLQVQGGEPVLSPSPRVVKDIKLGSHDDGARPELDYGDFELKREHLELFEHLRRLGSGTVDFIEVKRGLPLRLMIEQRI